MSKLKIIGNCLNICVGEGEGGGDSKGMSYIKGCSLLICKQLKIKHSMIGIYIITQILRNNYFILRSLILPHYVVKNQVS